MMRPQSERAGSGRRRAVVFGIVTLLLGLLLGRSLSTPSSPTGGDRAAAPASAGAAWTLAGVPVAFPDTARGAAAAVAAYQRSFASPAILRPGVLRARVEVVATPDYAATMLAANSPGAKRIAAGPIGEGLRSASRTLYAAVPIGYRVEAFSPGRARVLTWGFTLLGNSTSVEPAAYFGLTTTELLWIEGRWRIAETRGGFGPTPRLASRPGSLGAFGVIDVMRGLNGYELAP